MKLENKVIVITGGSHGLGEVLAYKVAKEGAIVVLLARNKGPLEKVKKKIQDDGGKAEYFVVDIRNLESIKKAVKEVMDKFKTVDILVNNAGVWTDEEIERKRPEQAKDALDTNVLGNIWMTKEILPIMKEKNSGYIFNVISTSGLPDWDNTLWQTYGATKWAMSGYSKALTDSLRNTKIKVTSFYPGGMDTNIFDAAGAAISHNEPWMMKIEDVVDIMVFALTRPDDVLMERIAVTKVE